MAETLSKRPRREGPAGEEETGEAVTKRHCLHSRPSYHHILSSLLEETPDEVDSAQEDLSSLITILQQELASSADHPLSPSDANEALTMDQVAYHTHLLEEEEEEAEVMMRHLLEASDDELGIPSREDEEEEGVVLVTDEREVLVYDEGGFWEMEDEAANYYELVHSGLFL